MSENLDREVLKRLQSPTREISDTEISTQKTIVEHKFQKSKQRNQRVVRQRANENLKETRSAYALAATLATFPFTVADIHDLSIASRELLYGLIARVTLLYLISLRDTTSTREFTRRIPQWAQTSLSAVLCALALETTPFQSTITHVLDLYEHSESTSSRKGFLSEKTVESNENSIFEHAEALGRSELAKETNVYKTGTTNSSLDFLNCLPLELYEMLNPQPLKTSLISDGHFSALQLTINSAFSPDNAEDIVSALLGHKVNIPSHLKEHFNFLNFKHTRSNALRWMVAESSESSSDSSEHGMSGKKTDVPLVSYLEPKVDYSKYFFENSSQRLSPHDIADYIDYFLTKQFENLEIYSEKVRQPPSALALVLRNIFFICLLNKHLDARFVMVIARTAAALDIPFQGLLLAIQVELAREVNIQQSTIEKETTESSHQKKIRRLKVFGVAAGLGALTGLTVGLAAPAIAAGFGALGIAGMSGAVSFMTTTGGSATLASLFGAGTAGFSGWKYFRRVDKIKVFRFDKLQPVLGAKAKCSRKSSSSWRTAFKKIPCDVPNSPSDQMEKQKLIYLDTAAVSCRHPSSNMKSNLHLNVFFIKYPLPLSVVICISGWLRQLSDIWNPWRSICSCHVEVYALRWDPATLLDLGTFMLNILSQRVAVTATNLWLQTTVASALSLALMWPITLIQYASQLDNTWMVCRERSTQAGRLLAEVIADEQIVGSRPISLIGFSMGARVIYSCLQELHRRNVFHRVQDAILMGGPVSCDRASWQRCRDVVAGRLVNVYSPADWLLAFLYRYMEWAITVAGLSTVKVNGVENYNVTGIITSHCQYADKLREILTYIGYQGVEYQTEASALAAGDGVNVKDELVISYTEHINETKPV